MNSPKTPYNLIEPHYFTKEEIKSFLNKATPIEISPNDGDIAFHIDELKIPSNLKFYLEIPSDFENEGRETVGYRISLRKQNPNYENEKQIFWKEMEAFEAEYRLSNKKYKIIDLLDELLNYDNKLCVSNKKDCLMKLNKEFKDFIFDVENTNENSTNS